MLNVLAVITAFGYLMPWSSGSGGKTMRCLQQISRFPSCIKGVMGKH